MKKPDFLQVLLNIAAPRLNALGYEYDASLQDRSIEYGFSKLLDGTITAQITFQRHQQDEIPYGFGFTVNVARQQDVPSNPWLLGTHEGRFRARLPHLIVDAVGLRVYPRQDYWWEANTTDELQQTLTDAVDRLEKYGIPALEDKRFQYIHSGVGPEEWNVFQDILDRQAIDELSAIGYTSRNDPVQFWAPSRAKPHRYFSKALDNGLFAFISFHPMYWIDSHPKESDEPVILATVPKIHHFGILIARKRSVYPHAEIIPAETACFQGWLGLNTGTPAEVSRFISKAALWDYSEAAGALFAYDAETKTLASTYPGNVRASLTVQISKAVEKIKKDGISLLENIA